MLPILGIVGGIGSGKSVAAEAMQKLGGHLIVADQLGHDALIQADIKRQLVERWGEQILNDQGNPDRRKIAAIVFSKEVERRYLEALVFPYIENRIVEEVSQAQTLAVEKFIILDAAIMMETGWDRHCDKIVFVEAPREQRLARLKETRGWDEAEVERREAAQLPLEEKKRRADATLINDEKPEKVAGQVERLLLHWRVI